MAWASVGLAGSTANATLNSSIITVTLNGQAGSGGNISDLLVFNIGTMRATTVGNVDAGAVLGVADSKANTWVKSREIQSSGATVAAGNLCSLWYCNVEKALTTADTVSCTLSSTADRDLNAGIVWRFSKSGAAVKSNSTYSVGLTSSALGARDLAENGSEFLRVRACQVRIRSSIAHSFSTTAGWSAMGTAESPTTLAVFSCGEYLITSDTTAASNPIIVGTLTASATIYADFEESTLMGDSIF
jgi:hypothetical protein